MNGATRSTLARAQSVGRDVRAPKVTAGLRPPPPPRLRRERERALVAVGVLEIVDPHVGALPGDCGPARGGPCPQETCGLGGRGGRVRVGQGAQKRGGDGFSSVQQPNHGLIGW
jgi:hypothetical protein